MDVSAGAVFNIRIDDTGVKEVIRGVERELYDFSISGRAAFQDFERSLVNPVKRIGDVRERIAGEVKKVANEVQKVKLSAGNFFPLDIISNFATDAIMGVFSSFTDVVGDAFKGVADAGDEFVKLSKKTGLSAESISALSYASQRSDVSLEALTSSASALGNSINGSSKDVAAALAECGLSLDSLKDKTELDQFK